MSGKVPATRRKRSNRRTRAEARRWRRPFSTFSDCKRRLRLRVRHPHGVTRRTSNVDLKARIFKARRLLQMLDDVSQLSRVALLAVHAPRRSRQAALVALLKTLLHYHGAAKRTTGNLVSPEISFFPEKCDRHYRYLFLRLLVSFLLTTRLRFRSGWSSPPRATTCLSAVGPDRLALDPGPHPLSFALPLAQHAREPGLAPPQISNDRGARCARRKERAAARHATVTTANMAEDRRHPPRGHRRVRGNRLSNALRSRWRSSDARRRSWTAMRGSVKNFFFLAYRKVRRHLRRSRR